MSATPGHALHVRIDSLSKHYGAVVAVDRVSLDVAAGEFLTLLGPSGSGKTTLLMMIAGFTRPTEGSIRIDGQEIVHLPPHKREIGMVFQNYALFPHMNVGDNIAYPLKLRRVGRAERETRVRRVLDLVQLSGMEGRRINQLSGGQRQRVALARAIVFEPRILLMDEPLSALDKQLRETMQIELRRLHDRFGMTTISVTHDQREALTMSDRVAVFSKGRLAQVAMPAHLYDKPDSRFVAEFIGESSFLPVEKSSAGLSYRDRPLKLDAACDPGMRKPMLMMRPERVVLAAAGKAVAQTDCNVFDGVIRERVFQGDSVLVDVTLPGDEIVHVRLPNHSRALAECPDVGDRVQVMLHRSDTRIVAAES